MQKSENVVMKDARLNDGLLEFADTYLREGFPNPTRLGCPEDQALQNLAENPMRGNPFLTEHISCCSPCYARYATLLQHHKARQPTGMLSEISANWNIRRVVLAWSAGAVVLVSVVALWLTIGRRPEPIYSSLTIDLRSASPVRGADQEGPELKIQIPQRPLDLAIQLPLGSEDKAYRISLRSDRDIVWARRVSASFNDHVATLSTRVDLSLLAAGLYEIVIESETGTRFEYPVRVIKLQ